MPGGCGGCPAGTATVTAQMVSVNPTNATVKFELTTVGAYVTLVWGNTTSYGFTALAANEPLDTWISVFLDYLEPSTTFYYNITAATGCYNTGYTTGSFATGTDNALVVQGIVHDTNGAKGSGLFIMVNCTTSSLWYSDGYTDSNGYFSLNVGGVGGAYCPAHSLGHFRVAVFTSNSNGGYWTGHWNETIIVWAPQFLNVNLPLNHKTYVPASAEFVHTSWADISSFSTTVYTTTGSSWNYAGTGGSTSESASAQWGTNSIPSGVSLLTKAEYWTSGTAIFNAVNARKASLGGLSFFDQLGYQFIRNGWSDWITSAPSGGYCTSTEFPSATLTLTLSGSFTTSSGYDFDIGVSAGPASASVPIQSALESTSGYTTTVTFTFTNPSPGSMAYFLTYTEGGSGPTDTQAIVAHSWLVSSC